MPLNPTPQRQRIITFPTPNVNDYLFLESVDTERLGDYGKSVPEYGTKHPDFKQWPNHRLVHVESADEQNRYYRYYYAADQLDQDVDNWSYTQADISGTKFDAVARDYVIRRTEFDPDSHAMGDVMPDIPEGKFDGTYILVERNQIPINDKVLNGLYVVERRIYANRVTTCRLDFDEFFSTTNYTKKNLVYASETPAGGGGLTIAELVADPSHAYWQMGDDGVIRTAQQISDNWYAITEQQVVNTDDGGTISYQTFVTYDFPPVLESVEIDAWDLRSGGARSFPRTIYSKGAYRGPCKAEITASWSATQGIAGEPDDPPRAERITVTTPFFSLNLPPTLHEEVQIRVSNGTEDETYKYTAGVYDAAATNITNWDSMISDGLIIAKTQKQFRGGWLTETVKVYAPADTP